MDKENKVNGEKVKKQVDVGPVNEVLAPMGNYMVGLIGGKFTGLATINAEVSFVDGKIVEHVVELKSKIRKIANPINSEAN